MTRPLRPEDREVLRARGARANTAGRFEAHAAEAVDDGWQAEPGAAPATEITEERPRRAITRNDSPDIPFERSLNPYRGCEHGCIYCYARPTHAWLGLSPGLDFETRLIARPEMPDVLARELARPGYTPAPIAIGTTTDPYQPAERDRGLMRAVLRVLADHRHPLTITTRGALIERDLDILAPMAAEGLVHVAISLTTLDAGLARRMEPRAPAPARRITAIRRLSAAGVPVRAMIAPVIPALTDHEIEALLAEAAGAGARAADWTLLRLPHEVAALFSEWLADARPDRAGRVMNRLREMRGGRDNDPRFGVRMRGEGVHAELLDRRFHIARRRLGLADGLPALRRDLFAVPPRAGDQLSLF